MTTPFKPFIEAQNAKAIAERDKVMATASWDNEADRIAIVDRMKHAYPYIGVIPCPVGGYEYHLFSTNDDVVGWMFFWSGEYEKAMLELWHQITTRPLKGVVLDIGAYSGLYAMVAARNGCTTHAFELVLRTAERAKINFRINGLAKHITLHPYGLSDSDRVVDVLMPRASDFLGTGNSIDEKSHVDTVETVKSTARAFSSVMEEIAPAPLAAIKIDVEGHEFELLSAMRPWLERDRPEMIIEISRRVDDCIALLKAMKYTLKPMQGSNFHAVP